MKYHSQMKVYIKAKKVLDIIPISAFHFDLMNLPTVPEGMSSIWAHKLVNKLNSKFYLDFTFWLQE